MINSKNVARVYKGEYLLSKPLAEQSQAFKDLMKQLEELNTRSDEEEA